MSINNTISHAIQIIENLKDPWGIKSSESHHIFMNEAALAFTNTPKNFPIDGLFDEEFPTTWSVLSEDLKKHDEMTKKRLSSTQVIEIDYWNGSTELTPYISEKIPLLDNNKECVAILWNVKKIINFKELIFNQLDFKKSALTNNFTQSLFTKKELEIIFFAQRRLSYKEIAITLKISPRTVKYHLNIIYQKAQVHSISQLVEYCKHTRLDTYIPERLLNQCILFTVS